VRQGGVRARRAAREEYEFEFNDAAREFSGGGGGSEESEEEKEEEKEDFEQRFR
jgi:hypothetical protein